MHARDTKSVILDTALRLFNQDGSKHVSTNRIAAEIGISVGNLYYHFNNKEDIIRSLYDRMVNGEDVLWSSKREPTLSHLRNLFDQQIQAMWEYRYFHRERIELLNKDPWLMERNHQVRTRRREEMAAIIIGLVEAGLFNPMEDAETLSAMVKAIWIVCENWIAFLELEGEQVDRGSIHDGADLIMRLFQAHLTGKGRSSLH